MLQGNIARLRKNHGLTQVEFAKQLHVTQSAVSHWESGRSIPDTVQLFRIAEFFNVSVDELGITGAEPAAKPVQVVVSKTETAPAPDARAEAKRLLEGLSDDQYQAALQYLQFLKAQKG